MKKLLLAITLLLLLTSLALADDVSTGTVCYGDVCYTDPATLHVGNPPASGDPTVFTTTTFEVLQNTGGKIPNLDNPWLLILGVPNTSSANPFGTGITSISPSGTWSFASGQPLATMNAASGNTDAYALLHLTADTNSNIFVNWAAADLADAGIHATSFGLYEFAITAPLGPKGTVTFTFNNLPDGTIVIAWGKTTQTTTTTTYDKKGKPHTSSTTNITIYDTPFTEAGLYEPPHVPEPGSMMLLGAGMAGLSLLRRFRE